MKKLVTVLFAATALIASCTSEEKPETPAGPPEIAFEIDEDLDVKTRGEIKTSFSTGQFFNAFAWKSGDASAFFDLRGKTTSPTEAKLVDKAADTDNKQYWPDGTINMRFMAFYPFQASGLTPTWAGMSMSTDYEVKTDFYSQEDLLYAYTPVSGKTAPLHFRHALTRVTFSCKVADVPGGTTSVKVKSITLNGAPVKGKFSFTAGTGATSTTYEGGTLAWNGRTTGNRTATLINGGNDYARDIKAATSSYVSIFNDAYAGKDSFFLVPLFDHPAANSIQMSIVFTVNGIDRPAITAYVPTLTGAANDAKKWNPNVHVNYQLTYNVGNAAGQILFTGITVQSWGSAQDVPVSLN